MTRDDRDALESTYQRIWTDYLSKEDVRETIALHREQRRALLRLLERCVSRAGGEVGRVLEIGCGTGIDAYLVAEATGAQVSGSDVLPEAIELARSLGSEFSHGVEFFVADATAMPVADASFDVVFSQGVVEHFPDPAAIMSEQVRILRPGGYLIVDVPQLFSWYTVHKKRRMRASTWEFGWETQYSYERLARLGERFGLRPVDRAGYGYDGRRDLGLGYLRRAHNVLLHLPTRDRRLSRRIWNAFEGIWRQIEQRWGHRFLINVVVVFEKPVAS